MVESGQPAIVPVEFSSHRHADLPVEVLERREIFSRVDQARTATGQTAKQVLVERLVLEAKRLLVHTELSAAAVAAELSFSEATNFGNFFTRRAGTSPAVCEQGCARRPGLPRFSGSGSDITSIRWSEAPEKGLTSPVHRAQYRFTETIE